MPLTSLPHVRGLVLAAGAGRRMGGPKALLPAPGGGTLVEAATRSLLEGGCDGVTVVVGAAGDAVRAVVEAMPEAGDIEVMECTGWDEGMGASLRAGLGGIRAKAGSADIEAVLVTLVDLPDVTPEVVRRLLAPGAASLRLPPPPDAAAGAELSGAPPGSTRGAELGQDDRRAGDWRRELRRAAYRGKPGHPALIGRHFWDETIATAVGDRGARELYSTHPHHLVECGDLATGRDVDTPDAAASWGLPSANRGRE